MEHDGQREQPEVQAALAHLAEPEVQVRVAGSRSWSGGGWMVWWEARRTIRRPPVVGSLERLAGG